MRYAVLYSRIRSEIRCCSALRTFGRPLALATSPALGLCAYAALASVDAKFVNQVSSGCVLPQNEQHCFAPSASLTFFSRAKCASEAMKRKHDVLVDAQSRLDSLAAQPSLAQAKTGQYLQGQDLLTESVF